ncbi:hypothetical protein ACIBG4_40565 [Nonomuraea sp. NPDC050383]|uniref:hypothetical protein n=1 Tax=Nonomuraea sp. NPDC050383 TaxID=3364362 RepID=UPI0037A03FA1
MSVGGFEPIAVYDVRDRWWMDEPTAHDRLLTWLRSYEVDPTYTRRFEVYLIDCPSLRVYDLALDEHGQPYRDGPGMALREPYDVLLRDLPPECPGRPSPRPPGALRLLHRRAAESDSPDPHAP